MTDEHRQRLSELLDGELNSRSAVRVLDVVEGDGELRATWERYHLIGQALRGEPIDSEARLLAERIRAQIAVEPVPLRPRRASFAKRLGSQRFGAIAMAASVAFVAFAAAPMLFRDTGPVSDEDLSTPQLVERESIPMSRLQLEHPGLASKLDLYLVTHQATAPASGAKGMLPYATLVGYESPR